MFGRFFCISPLFGKKNVHSNPCHHAQKNGSSFSASKKMFRHTPECFGIILRFLFFSSHRRDFPVFLEQKHHKTISFKKASFFYRCSFPSDASSSSLFCTFRANSTPKRFVADFRYPSTIPLSTSFMRKAFAHSQFEANRMSGHVFAWCPST